MWKTKIINCCMLMEASENNNLMRNKAGKVETQKTENLNNNQRKIINKAINVE